MSNNIEEIKGEENSYSDDDLYNISSWGADLSFREIVSMYDDGDLIKPELQRKYVWNKLEASRFIDSILLGLPVPSIFLAKEHDETKLIVDGYQRIMTVYDYMKGCFSKDNKPFKLTNTEAINARWRGKSFDELSKEEQRKIRTTTIHAIIFEQKSPKNDTGMYQIFERINTGGRTLKPQEIRNCVYQGEFNKLLFELNKDDSWRYLIGDQEDSRMADLELILRYFAMKELYLDKESVTQINLVKFLNEYMSKNQNIDSKAYDNYKKEFEFIIKILRDQLSNKAFRNLKKNSDSVFTNKVSPSIFDAVTVSTYLALENKKDITNLFEKYKKLCADTDFIDVTSKHTTNIKNIFKRIEIAYRILYEE